MREGESISTAIYLYSYLYGHMTYLSVYHSQWDPFHPAMVLTSSGQLLFLFLEQSLLFLELFSLHKVSNVLPSLLTKKEIYIYVINRYILDRKKIKYSNSSIFTQVKFIEINMSYDISFNCIKSSSYVCFKLFSLNVIMNSQLS